MDKIKKYKNRFFSLLESEMGNVKPLIIESIDESKNIINNLLINDFDFTEDGEEEKDGIIKNQFVKEFGDKKLSILTMLSNDDSPLSNMIAVVVFLDDEKITSKLTNGKSYESIPFNEFATKGKDLIQKAVDYAQSETGSEEVGGEGKTSFKVFIDLMTSLGMELVGESEDTIKFSKKVGDNKEFLVQIKDIGDNFKITPVVFDIAAFKDPEFFGVKLPVMVGTINIEKNQKDNPTKLSLELPKDGFEKRMNEFKELLNKGEEITREYKGKDIVLKDWESNTERLR